MEKVKFLCILIFYYVSNTLAQQKITGDTLVLGNSRRAYSINVKAGFVDWNLWPASCGRIISGQGSADIIVRWNENASNHCRLTALLNSPDLETSIAIAKNISIKNQDNDSYKKNPDLRFSKTKDSLRFFYAVICDSTIHRRTVRLADSSLKKEKPAGIKWVITNLKTKKQSVENVMALRIKLEAAKYEILMEYTINNKKYILKDTLTIFRAPQPAFMASTQTPCQGSIINFSNTSQYPGLAKLNTFYFGNGEACNFAEKEEVMPYSYESKGAQTILMTHLESIDGYGCIFKSTETAVSVQENKFTLTNISIEPRAYELKKAGDKVIIKCVTGQNMSPGNPNMPFSYLWNTGQVTDQIMVSEQGNYQVMVTDKIGCKNNYNLTARITQAHK